MRKRIEFYEHNASHNQKIIQFGISNSSLVDTTENNPVRKILAAEGCENFINYIEWLGLSEDKNPIILSSMHHYYFDAEEMRDVNTVISLKELNHIKQIKNFLHSIFHNLRHNRYFIGCFVDNNKSNGYELRDSSSDYHINKRFEYIENGIISSNPFLNMLFSKMDQRTNKYLSQKTVTTLLSDHGFKALDMTEINGLTYFCAQRLRITDS